MKKSAFVVTASVDVKTKANDKKLDPVVRFEVTEDGKPFCKVKAEYYDMPAVQVDMLEAIIAKELGTLPFTKNVDEKGMVELEGKAILALQNLNALAVKALPLPKEERDKEVEKAASNLPKKYRK